VMASNKNVLGSGLEILKTSKAWSSKIEVMWWMQTKSHTFNWKSEISHAWICDSCTRWKKEVWAMELSSTLFVDAFVTFACCGDLGCWARSVSGL
jgi:hypothetical protein